MDSDNDSHHSKSEFYYPDKETPKRQKHAHGETASVKNQHKYFL